jgi:hypothetical protein
MGIKKFWQNQSPPEQDDPTPPESIGQGSEKRVPPPPAADDVPPDSSGRGDSARAESVPDDTMVGDLVDHWDTPGHEPSQASESSEEPPSQQSPSLDRAGDGTGTASDGPGTSAAEDHVAPEEDQVPVAEPFETDDGLVRFGAAAKLLPVPPRSAEQFGDLLEAPSDIAMDWLDLDGGSVRAVSARGHMHRYLGEVRQDSFAIHAHSDYVLMAVADGVGSASASHLGSAITARNVVIDTTVASRLRDAGAEPTKETLYSLAELLIYEARRRHLEPKSLATNLIVAAVPRKVSDDGIFNVTFLKLGDPSAWRHDGERWVECRATKPVEDSDGPTSTKTDALPLHTEATVWREVFEPGETVAVASDGVGNILGANKDFARELSALWRITAPSPAILLKYVDATVKSYDDDRTFVGCRFS